MYPCPYCHSQLTWVPQYQQYYCYFCHRYVQAAAPPPNQVYYPQQSPQAAPHASTSGSPTAPPQDGPRPVPVSAQTPQGGSPTPPAAIEEPANPPSSAAAPAQQTGAKPSIEYVQKSGPGQPAHVPVIGQPSAREPIYLCKLCGTKLEVQNQKWYCGRCQQYK